MVSEVYLELKFKCTMCVIASVCVCECVEMCMRMLRERLTEYSIYLFSLISPLIITHIPSQQFSNAAFSDRWLLNSNRVLLHIILAL